MRSKFSIMGETPEGDKVVSGVFDLFDSHGLPLDVVLDLCNQRGWIPCWNTFYADAKVSGWKHATVMLRLIPVVNDIYGKEVSEVVTQRLGTLGVDDSHRKRG
jgi:hypothetical protein